MIHAQLPNAPAALCEHFFASWSPHVAGQPYTIRYELTTCRKCLALFLKHPQLRNQAHKLALVHGETGTLAGTPINGVEEAKAYWQQAAKEGKKVPQYAKDLYLSGKTAAEALSRGKR